MAENSARLWPRFRQEKEMWLSIQQIVAEVSAREKEIWLRFQQIQGVVYLISKHERGRKIREIGITWYVWLKAWSCVLLYFYITWMIDLRKP